MKKSNVNLEKLVLDFSALIKMANKTLKIAESFTGGYISSLFTMQDGASEFFLEGIVCYSNLSKAERLGVSKKIIDIFGPVSGVVALSMTKALLKSADIAIATTGYAGTFEKEPNKGLCFVAAGNKEKVIVERYFFQGSRKEIIMQGAEKAILLAKTLI